ncbi:hypothetical protein K449DRAFT_430263 [Hypoxylon sp. EC38]|nr:hypothetical protein K449DRAFT_430263 [Hypoxylon sp. EC38]
MNSDALDAEVKSKVLSDSATGEITRWLQYAWEQHNLVRVYSYCPGPGLQGKIISALSGLDSIESRLRRVERKNKEKQKEKEDESKGKNHGHHRHHRHRP